MLDAAAHTQRNYCNLCCYYYHYCVEQEGTGTVAAVSAAASGTGTRPLRRVHSGSLRDLDRAAPPGLRGETRHTGALSRQRSAGNGSSDSSSAARRAPPGSEPSSFAASRHNLHRTSGDQHSGRSSTASGDAPLSVQHEGSSRGRNSRSSSDRRRTAGSAPPAFCGAANNSSSSTPVGASWGGNFELDCHEGHAATGASSGEQLQRSLGDNR
jgi:hypothetical protein